MLLLISSTVAGIIFAAASFVLEGIENHRKHNEAPALPHRAHVSFYTKK